MFIGLLNWQKHYITDKTEALSYYLQNRDQYSAWFDQSTNISAVHSHKMPLDKITGIYYAKINSEEQLKLTIESLEHISRSVSGLIVIFEGNTDYIDRLSQLSNITIQSIHNIDWTMILNHIQSFDQCLYTNNSLYFYEQIYNIIAHKDASSIWSLTDKYNSIFYAVDQKSRTIEPKFFYTLNTNCFVFSNEHMNDILKILSSQPIDLSHSMNYLVTKYSKENKIRLEYYYKHNIDKESFWYNLFEFDVLNYTHLIKKYHIPALNMVDISETHNQTIVQDILKPVKQSKSYNMACHIHIGYVSDRCLADIKRTITTLRSLVPKIDFYITSVSQIDGLSATVVPNRGADIGPFLYTLQHRIAHQGYDYILKLHSKTHHGFRTFVYDCLLMHMPHILEILHNNNYAIFGPKHHEMRLDYINRPIINHICHEYNIIYEPSKITFYAGTMFLTTTELLLEFINQYGLDLNKEYWSLEDGYFQNHHATRTHSWERILSGIIPYVMGVKKLSL